VKTLARIRQQLDRIRGLAATPQLFDASPGVSNWCIGEHLDHIVKVSSSVVGRVRETNPPVEKRGISLIGRAILTLGWIPRGRGRSPSRLVGTRVPAADLEASLAKLESAVAGIEPAMIALKSPTVPHPVFRGLTPAQALRFVEIHNAHHLKIVDEILRRR
jgi:hypothetical protein